MMWHAEEFYINDFIGEDNYDLSHPWNLRIGEYWDMIRKCFHCLYLKNNDMDKLKSQMYHIAIDRPTELYYCSARKSQCKWHVGI